MSSRSAKKSGSSVMVPAKQGGEHPTQFQGKAVMTESKEKSKGFKRGGRAKGDQMAAGECGPGMSQKPPRKASGGGVGTMRGRSPLSAANKMDAASTKTSH